MLSPRIRQHSYPTMPRERRILWQHEASDSQRGLNREASKETYDSILAKYSFRPPPVPLGPLLADALTIGQELILACLFLARHRAALILENSENDGLKMLGPHVFFRSSISGIFMMCAMMVVVGYNNRVLDESFKRNRRPLYRRVSDAAIVAILMRFLSAVLKTLTASYSSDTVHALSISGLVLHLFTCNYAYANGAMQTNESVLSLSATFFSTTLLASRIGDNVSVFVFVSTSVILFGLYPDARHRMAVTAQKHGIWVQLTFILTVLFGLAAYLLLSPKEMTLVSLLLFSICVISPLWKYYLLSQRVCLNGPWDIVSIPQARQ